MNSRTINCYFVGYFERSRGFKFYDSSTRSFFEISNARFPEDVEFGGGDKVQDIVFEEEFISLPTVDAKNDQTLPTVVVENNQAPNIQENIQEEPPIQNEELAPVHEE